MCNTADTILAHEPTRIHRVSSTRGLFPEHKHMRDFGAKDYSTNDAERYEQERSSTSAKCIEPTSTVSRRRMTSRHFGSKCGADFVSQPKVSLVVWFGCNWNLGRRFHASCERWFGGEYVRNTRRIDTF